MPDIYLPNIIKLELTNFSLYCEQSVVMDFSKPVSCLMGANGIGKSTLLNCVNFAITGRINPTNKKLKSIDTLDRGNNYYLQYFDGRISEVDKDYASTRIVFMLGNKRIEVVRNFFPDNSILEYKLDNETQDPRNYEDDVVRLANLNNYAQFVFLQLKVLTFDESRDCLFWNPSILTPTIFLCLGESVDNAERADELAREIQKVNSRIRNVQWEISKQSARLTTLIEEKSKTEEARPHYASEDEASAQNEYEEIIKELEEGESYHQGHTKERQQIYARITELTVEKVRLRKEYEEHYAELYAGNGHFYRNPIIMALTSDGCPICHTAHQKLPEHIEQALNQNVCPLCGEHIPETASEQTEIIAKLAKIDNNLSKIEHELEELILRQQTVEEQLDNLKKKIEELKKRKEDIEKKCYSFLLDDATDDSWSSRIKALQDSISAVEREKFKHIEDRDQLKMEYDNLCVSLEKIYRRVQVDFLPIFKKFAKEFTGLDLDMTLVSVTDDGRKMFKFILQIDDTNRDNEFELSESQRFFIDIALRMAIVTFVCSKTTASTSMLIDTPEDSLDIAYETNAGSMFYEYIAANQKMIITANLNSSGLIQTLAGKTKFEKFELISMLKWAKLSSVQNTHFELFERSISTIESKLEG